jgi:hypothetical protein
MRYTSVKCTFVRYTPTKDTPVEAHAHAVHARGMHAHEVSAPNKQAWWGAPYAQNSVDLVVIGIDHSRGIPEQILPGFQSYLFIFVACASVRRIKGIGDLEHGFEYRSMDCTINIDTVSTVSSAKKLITPERNTLSDTTIEATECLKA